MPINITMPALSPTMTEGNLAKWLKREGDVVKAGDVIAEIETDKATMEVEAVDEGTLGKIVIPAGTQGVAVNSVIGVLLEEGEDLSSVILSEGRKPEVEGSKKDSSTSPSLRSGSAQNDKNSVFPSPRTPLASFPLPKGESDPSNMRGSGEGIRSRIYASPLAKRLAGEKGIDISKITGSGPRGRVVKADIENTKAGSSPLGPTSRPAGPDARKLADLLGMKYTAIPNNNIRKVVASRLLESKVTVPHFYLTIDCRIDALLEARRQINELANGAYKLSVNDLVIKAVAMALKAYPAANVSWTEEAILQYEHADISVAVATPNGLMTPIVKTAETKSVKEISEQVKDLATRAKDGKLKPEEFQGGTFTVSNLGMFGIKEFGAIINPPQSCILAVGAGLQQPIAENGEIKIATIMTCTLSVDHRSVDGAVGAEYLQIFKKFIENPAGLLV